VTAGRRTARRLRLILTLVGNDCDQGRRQAISGGLMSTSDDAHVLSHFATLSINPMSIKLAHKFPANIIAPLVSLP
jgi:hypothetical protein